MKKTLLLSALTIVLICGALYFQTTYLNSVHSDSANNVGNSTQNSSKDSNTVNVQSSEQSSKADKTKAPDFELTDLEGHKVTLSSLKGKRVFLNFWATWCSPCRGEMPEIEKLYQETEDSDLIILAVNLGESKLTAKTFMSVNHYNFNVLLDTNEKAASLYGISSIPTSFFIDSEGYISSYHNGAMDLGQMKRYIEKLDRR